MLSAISRTVSELSVFRRFTGTYIFSIANFSDLSIVDCPSMKDPRGRLQCRGIMRRLASIDQGRERVETIARRRSAPHPTPLPASAGEREREQTELAAPASAEGIRRRGLSG